ncbi:MAG: DNA repair protein [Clostridia bacterium]|nr:DNA repair protein [Clostridia bacterium]
MPEKQRVYFVIDMKSFFASVECAERGLDAMTAKLIVADASRTDKTICLAVSPALKALGIKNRCRLYEVPKNIEYIIAKPRMKKYIDYSAKIYGIYLQYIDKSDIHVYSIDECIIDATDYLKLYKIKAKAFVKKLMTEIWEKLGIPATAGIGSNMYLAKIALDITAKNSDDGIGWLTEEKFIKELWRHKPLSDFWGISTGTVNRLSKYAIHNMEDIAHCNEELLFREFGVNAEIIIDHSWGKESCLMEDIKNYKGKSKSISNSQILPCAYTPADASLVMREMIQEGCYRLTRINMVTCLIHIYVGYQNELKTMAKGTKRLKITTNLYSQIIPYADALYDEIVDKTKKIRKIAYSFANLLPEDYEQYDLFTDIEKLKKEKILIKSLLDIKNKFGKNAILKGTDYNPKATQRERNNQIGGHNSGTEEDA